MTSGTLTGSLLFAPTLHGNVPLLGVAVVCGMYWLGGRSYRAALRAGTIARARILAQRWRNGAFALGMLALLVALQEPLDGYADKLFWVHMTQHLLLLAVVAPLITLSAPWMRIWRALPLSWRRPLARWALKRGSAAPLRALCHAAAQPLIAFLLFSVTIIAWHLPAAYDLTLRSDAVHYTEHATFLIAALLVWGQLVDSAPFHGRLSPPRRCALVIATLLPQWILGMMLAFSSSPWYAAYADLGHRPGGISALTDQTLAGGVMWVPGSLPWALAVFILLYRWMAQPEPQPPQAPLRAEARPLHPHPRSPDPHPRSPDPHPRSPDPHPHSPHPHPRSPDPHRRAPVGAPALHIATIDGRPDA